MINYNDVAKRFMKYHREMVFLDKQLSAITTALIGAVGEGYNVNVLSYDEKELKDIDLSFQKNIFNECGKTVEDLESAMPTIIQKKKLTDLSLKNEMDILKIHFSMCPSCFLSKYILIPNHVINAMGVDFLENLKKEMEKSTSDDGYLYTAMTVADGYMVFCERRNKLEKIKSFLTLDNKLLDNEIHDLKITEETETLLGYLLILIHESGNDDA